MQVFFQILILKIKKKSDNSFMDIKQMIPLILQVLKDFRVIGTVIVMILVIKFAKFITTYKKIPRKNIKSKQKSQGVKPSVSAAESLSLIHI